MALVRRIPVQFALLLLIAVALRAYTFGHPNLFIDEAFYFAAGNAMHQGALPYVDIWDRKPFGLFLIYYLAAAVSPNPAAYQIAATLFAAATALVIARIAGQWRAGTGGLLGGTAYLFLLAPFQGFGGQSPVYYNLFVALAVLLVLKNLAALRDGKVTNQLLLAMLSAGFAITIKTTALFEAMFLGLYALFALPMAERIRKGIWLALAGAAPALAVMVLYGLNGHFADYWHAMTGANLSSNRWDGPTALIRLRLMIGAMAPIALLAAFGWIELQGEARRLAGLWILAALAGLFAFPYFHKHYALPLLVPLCATAGVFLSRKWIGPLALIALCLFEFRNSPPIDRNHTERATVAMEQVSATITAHGGDRGLLVYEGPPFLYTMAKQPFPSPLAFPAHLYHAIERNVSRLETLSEVKRVLATRPGVVVMTREPRDGPLNTETFAAVDNYVTRNCRLVAEVEIPERLRSDQVLVWGDCK